MKLLIFMLMCLLIPTFVFSADLSEKEKAKCEIRALSAEANVISLQLQIMKADFDRLVAIREGKMAELEVWKEKLKQIEDKEKALTKKEESETKQKEQGL